VPGQRGSFRTQWVPAAQLSHIFFLVSASVPAAIKTGYIATRLLLGQALHFHPRLVWVPSFFSFLFFFPTLVTGSSRTFGELIILFYLFPIGHIIASETEEDIFRILGTSDHSMIY
jgi:hypothetical protein